MAGCAPCLRGQDQEAGGTWLGVGADGRFAALTNIRDPHQPPARKSRGELVARFQRFAVDWDDYLADVNGRSIEYAGFNLLVGTRTSFGITTPRESAPTPLVAGFAVIQCRAGYVVAEVVEGQGGVGAIVGGSTARSFAGDFERLRRPRCLLTCRTTGVGLATESLLSSVFIASPSYGTRASTALIVNADGTRHIVERSLGPMADS